jgi:hypothetical protein
MSLAGFVGGLLGPGVSAAQPPSPTQDSIVTLSSVSENFVQLLDLSFLIDARSGPSGESPSGSVRYFAGTPTFNDHVDAGSVTCLAVDGNRAVIGGYGLRIIGGNSFGPSNPPPPPQNAGFFLIVVDNGPPIEPNASVGPDLAGYPVQAGSTPPSDCSNVSPDSLSLVFGDIVVHDAQPVPVSKDQCKNGGWRNYGVFKNQGDCVSFVATGGKNPPGKAG